MIITSLRAENILKYRKLELADIPPSGIIAISGSNESGKSTIGETLCFALFGRTFSIDEDNLDKLFHWGASYCTVSCDFLVDQQPYQLIRTLDVEGKHSARLTTEDEEPLVAKGVEEVGDVLLELLGFEFDEFIDSFYLAQREITKPHPHSYAVKSMAGIASVEYVMFELDEEIEADQKIIDERQAELDQIEEEIEEIAVKPGYLVDQEKEHLLLLRTEALGRDHMSRLKKLSVAYQEAVSRMRRSVEARSNTITIQLACLALAVVFGGIGWLLKGASGSGVDLFRTLFAGWEEYAYSLILAAVVALVLSLIFFVHDWLLHLQSKEWRKRGVELAGGLDAVTVYARSSEIEHVLKINEDLSSTTDEVLDVVDKVEFSEATCLSLRGEVRDMHMGAEQASEDVAEILAWLRYVINVQREMLADLGRSIQREKRRMARVDELETMIPPLEEIILEHDERAALHEDALELLRGAGRYMSKRFNTDLRDLAAHTLPLFTDGRYEHLQIDEDLNVRVFSSEKRDYMELEEVSSGTQRQIMLAVRLALAQQLVDKTVEGKQFAFLDEPFAFFDQDRTRSSIKVLRRLSKEINQIWVVAQEFPKRLKYDREILCSRDADVLTDANTGKSA